MKRFKSVFLGCYAALPLNFVRVALVGCEVFTALVLISLALQQFPAAFGLKDASGLAQSIGASAARIPAAAVLIASALALADLVNARRK